VSGSEAKLRAAFERLAAAKSEDEVFRALLGDRYVDAANAKVKAASDRLAAERARIRRFSTTRNAGGAK